MGIGRNWWVSAPRPAKRMANQPTVVGGHSRRGCREGYIPREGAGCVGTSDRWPTWDGRLSCRGACGRDSYPPREAPRNLCVYDA
jgi:hypothetical protein